jgi:hypothetical protein
MACHSVAGMVTHEFFGSYGTRHVADLQEFVPNVEDSNRLESSTSKVPLRNVLDEMMIIQRNEDFLRFATG